MPQREWSTSPIAASHNRERTWWVSASGEDMPTLINRGVDDPLLECVLQAGYQIWQHVSWTADGWKVVRYHAERDGWELVATSPAELLGLVALRADHGAAPFRPEWWAPTDPEPVAKAPKSYVPKHGGGL